MSDGLNYAPSVFLLVGQSPDECCRDICAILKRKILTNRDIGAFFFGDPDAILMLEIPERVSHSKPPKDKQRILLVESDSQLREDVARFLATQYGTDAVGDAPAAFSLARETPPDLVLANVMTRRLDGVDLVREFRRNEQLRVVPIILYSSPAGEESCIEGLEAGANDYLITPYSNGQLLARIGSQLRASQMCDESFHALRASEERYRTLANTMNTGIWSAASNGDIVGEARGWEKMTGQTAEEYRGFNWIAAVHPDDRQRVREIWQQSIRDRTPVDMDFRVRQRDGSYHHVRAQGAPLHNPDGTVREWIGTIIDIDRRKRAEEALRRSEEEFRANFELAGIGQMQVEPKTGKILRVNPRFCEMIGYSPQELLAKTFWDITHLDDLHRNGPAAQPFVRDETNQLTIEKRFVRKDGSIMWGSLTATMIRDAEGQPLRAIAMIQDITHRRQSEALFHCEKVALEMVAQGASLTEVLQFVVASLQKQAGEGQIVSIVLLEEDGKRARLAASSGLPESYAERLKDGLPVSEVNGPCRVALTEKRPVMVADLATDPNWEAFGHQVTLYGFHGAWSTPIVSSDQRLLGSFCIYYSQPRTPGPVQQWAINTVTRTVALAIERKQAEAEREELLIRERAAREQAESANEVKDEFLAVVSHELRTPLTAISGWVHLLLEGKLDDAAGLRALQAIQRQARSQRQLIDDLLDVSRIVSGKLRLDRREVEPSRIINGAIDVVRPAAEAKNIHLAVDLDTTGTVSGDPERLQQVIWNLLSNAIKFTPEGGRVEICSRWVDSSIEIVVADSGQGIREDFLPYVFERFRQADVSTTRAHGGLGLGLAIVRHLIEIHGGTVQAESAGRGKGATFTIRLPGRAAHAGIAVSKNEPEVRQKISEAETELDETEVLGGLRILVVDDDSDGREILALQLTQHGATTSVSASADDALSKVDTFKPDVIVADIGMPGEDGYSLIRKVRNSPVHHARITPAIALTAYAGDVNRQRALEAGYQKHISKPAELEELVLTIARLAERR